MKLESMLLQADGRSVELLLRRNTSDSELVGQIFVDNAFDLQRLRRFQDLQAHLDRIKQKEARPLIVDAGANIGFASVYFSLQCPSALVVAIEPEPSNFAVLQRNVSSFPVVPVPCALASSPQLMTVVDAGEREWGFQALPSDTSQGGVEVECVTIDDIYRIHRKECVPFIVKIDIEGGESEVFSENVGWIDETPVLIVELHDWMMPEKRVSRNFLKSIVEKDRDFIHIGENIFSVANNLDRFSFAKR